MSVEVFCLAKKISGPVGIYTIQAQAFQTGEMQRNCPIDASIRVKGCRSDLLGIPPVSCEVLTHLNGRALCGWLMVKEGSQGQGG